MVGIIGVAKNQKRAVKLLKNIVDDISKRKVHLDFYGGTSGEAYLNELKKEISNNDLNEFVTFHGFVDDKNEIYGNIDILLMCSPNEAFGRVTIEAMAYGIPVIGYDSAGTAELIENGRNGFLYDDREIDLEESVKALLSNEELYDILSKGARNSAQLYSVERYGASIFKLINENGHDK
jgi:glycosyltransferase involved in cell wall biosynthesis